MLIASKISNINVGNGTIIIRTIPTTPNATITSIFSFKLNLFITYPTFWGLCIYF